MTDQITLAYLAGAMDSDGYFGIKRSTYHMRTRGDATNPVFMERCGLKQTTEQVPRLLKDVFGGNIRVDEPSTSNGKPLWGWQATDKRAADCARQLFPFLRIKKRQAELLLELRETKDDSRYRKMSYWFERENPDWRTMPMLTSQDVVQRMNYASISMVSQAVHNGSLLALPYDRSGHYAPRFPAALVDTMAAHQALAKDNRGRVRPPQLIAWRQKICDEVRLLNKIGTGNHPISMRTGIYTPK